MIYVIGGDFYDAQLGVDMLARMGIEAHPLAISRSPSHYKELLAQHHSLEEILEGKLKSVKADVFLVFCNTLSFATDWDKLAKDIATPILSLTRVYSEFMERYKSVGVVACFEDTVHNIRRFCDQNSHKTKTLSYALMSLIEAVENKDPRVHDILHTLIETSASLKAEAFVLGCTHFEDFDLANAPIDVVYPGQRLIQYALDNGYITRPYRVNVG